MPALFPHRVFDFDEVWDMAEAADALNHLTDAPLVNVVIPLTTLDDPYYMKLSPATYQRVTRVSDPCGSCVYDPDRCGECPRLVAWSR